MSYVDSRRRRYGEDPEFRKRIARINARSKVFGVLRCCPDMSDEDPEALGHEAILEMVAEDSRLFKDVKELKRRGN